MLMVRWERGKALTMTGDERFENNGDFSGGNIKSVIIQYIHSLFGSRRFISACTASDIKWMSGHDHVPNGSPYSSL